jgi:hypothetical protein
VTNRCRGIRVHDPVETLFTIAWNTHEESAIMLKPRYGHRESCKLAVRA